ADAKDVKFSVEGPGNVDAAGKYSGPGGSAHAAAMVNAEIGGLKAQARVRLIPEITTEKPWSFDFDDGVIPVTGIGIRYRHIPLDFDLYRDLKAKDHLAARLYIYLATQFTNVP